MNAIPLPQRSHNWRPPEYARASDVLAECLPVIAPARRVKVSQWAEEERKLNDNGSIVAWRNSVTPYMVEPMDYSNSRRFKGGVFVGPARTGKTDAFIVNRMGHAITCEPCDMRVIHMDQNAAREFSVKKVSALLRYSPSVGERLGRGRFDDSILEKRFQSGAILDIGWPVVSKVSASDIPLMLLTDYDRAPEDVQGEGNLFDLAFKRTQTFGSRGMTLAESSPGRIVLDEDFEAPDTQPHLMPPATGILALYNRGTRGRYYWACRDCGDRFEPDFKHLDYPNHGTPAERGAAVVMACPHCGAVYEPHHKKELNSRGSWLHEGKEGQLVGIEDELLRETDIVSWALTGAAAAFQPWQELVARYETALEELEKTGDETALKTTINVDQGHAYTPRAISSGADITVKSLKEMAERYPLKVMPEGTRFATVSIDTQKGKFVCQVDAWGHELERWLVDRFEIHTPPDTAPRASERAIDPARYAEDWEALFALLETAYPVAGTQYSLKPMALIVDSGGEAGVTRNAYSFYRRSKAMGYRRRVFLAKGLSGWERDRAKEVTPEKQEGKRVKLRSDLKVVRVGTWRLKSEVTASLAREDAGPGCYHLTKNLPKEVFEEFCAERKTPKGWELKPGKKRNEALDLGVYGLALVVALKGERIDWRRPPAWAATLERNAFAKLREPVEEAPPNTQDPEELQEEPESDSRPDAKAKPSRRKRAGGSRKKRAGRRTNISGF